MISMSSLVSGPSPRPSRLPIALLSAEEMLRELAVDDRDLRVLDDVRRPEVAAVEQLDAHRLEVAGRERVHERLHVLAVLGLVAFDRGGAVPFVAGQDRHAGMPGRLDPRRAAQAIEQLVVEIHRSRIVVSAQRRRQPERDQVVHLHAGVGGLQILQAAHEQSRAEQQQEAQRHLRGDEALAQEERSAGARDPADRVLERRPLIGIAGLERRQQPEHDAGDERQDECERQDPQIRRRLNQQRLLLRDERDQAARQRHRHARCPARRRSATAARSRSAAAAPAGRASRRATAAPRSRAARMKPRAISRFATFAHAISSTRPTIAISTTSAVEKSLRSGE